MKDQFRYWKHAIVPGLITVGATLINIMPEQSFLGLIGLGVLALVVLVYIVGEVVWNLQGKGRPCAACGKMVPMKSFRVRNICPGCGQQM